MFECVVIGAGQAGLATSYWLSKLGIEHVVLERGRVAETWRVARWDSFHLNTPNWATRLPGLAELPEPDAFAPLAQMIELFEEYAAIVDAPLQTGSEVSALRLRDGLFELAVGDASIAARSVVVASGAFQRPTTTRSAEVPEPVAQLHTTEYRRPGQLPAGGVLVVGSGQSACEIGLELLESGRDVHVAVGRAPWAPRRHRGRELVRWLIDVGMTEDTLEMLPTPEARLAGNVTVSGIRGGIDSSPLTLEAAGAQLYGRFLGFRNGRAVFADDLEQTLETAGAAERSLRQRFDQHAEAAGLDLPPHVESERRPRRGPAPTELPFGAAGISTVLWATGFRPDFGWIELDIFDQLGFPRAARGVTEIPGLAFVGLPWLHTRKSPLLLGVGCDAEHVARSVAGQLGRS